MRSAILFGLIACLAFSLVLAQEQSPKQSNDLSSVEKDIGQAVESQVRAKRQFGFGGPFGGFGGPIGFGGPFGGGFGGPFGGYGGGFGYGRPFYGGYGGFGRPFYGGFGRPFYG
ncbi:glycine-rich RNA-binding protein 2 [Drosophila eugracilis]|uniref:glycine-rich RNA-binding protein 2 n=1 Tax=Drosophila eugracilis TaxID=29029 RepID=UPI001BD931D7|nr:glycine-rich RNA-binding protein 2 [Drosophila eugracilis]